MPAIRTNPRISAFNRLLARDMIRLRHRETRHYLHMSGTGTTPDATWAWLGFGYQAEALRQRALARGEVWPFMTVHRDETGEDTP